MRFAYYEEGGRKIFTMSKLYRRYTVDIHQLNFSYKNVSFLKNDIYEISVLGRRVVL